MSDGMEARFTDFPIVSSESVEPGRFILRGSPGDLQIDVYETAVPVDSPGYSCTVRVVHRPTGLVASCGETKSVVVNRVRALEQMAVLLRQRAEREGAAP